MTKKEAYKNNSFQLQKRSSTFLVKNYSFVADTNELSHSSMAHNTTAFLDNLTGTDYVDFGKCQYSFGVAVLVQKGLKLLG